MTRDPLTRRDRVVRGALLREYRALARIKRRLLRRYASHVRWEQAALAAQVWRHAELVQARMDAIVVDVVRPHPGTRHLRSVSA